MIPLILLTLGNVLRHVTTFHGADDSLALFASGQAALHGQNPFVIMFIRDEERRIRSTSKGPRTTPERTGDDASGSAS